MARAANTETRRNTARCPSHQPITPAIAAMHITGVVKGGVAAHLTRQLSDGKKPGGEGGHGGSEDVPDDCHDSVRRQDVRR